MPVRRAAAIALMLLCLGAALAPTRVTLEGFAFDLPAGWTRRPMETNEDGVLYAAAAADGRSGLTVRARPLRRGESIARIEERCRLSGRVSCGETKDADGVTRLIARENCGGVVQLAVANVRVDESRVELIFYDELGENGAAETVVGSLSLEDTKEDIR